MKNRKILISAIISALVLIVCFFALGAGKNTEKTYIGTWKSGNTTMVVYPCHVGEFIDEEWGEKKIRKIEYTFSWEIDEGYLVIKEYFNGGVNAGAIHGIRSTKCYLSSDGGKTMTRITDIGGTTYKKVS